MQSNLTANCRRSRVRRLVICLIVMIAALASLAAPAHAGDYSITYGSSGLPINVAGPYWRGSSSGSPPWQITTNRIYAPPSTYSGGSYGQYQFYVPTGLSLYRFCFTSTVNTSNDFLYYIVDGDNSIIYGKTYGAGTRGTCSPGAPSYDTYTAGHHVDIALIFDRSTSVTSTTNNVTINSAVLSFHDTSNPVVSGVVAPSGWIGPNTCNSLRWTVGDSGSGAWRSQLYRDGQVEYAWQNPAAVTGPQPGASSAPFGVCLANPGSTGVHSYAIAASDYSGNQVSTTIATQRWDLTSPAASTSIVDGQNYSTYRPSFEFAASDADSGVASVQASIDGVAVQTASSGGAATFAAPADLSLGTHAVSLRVVDNVGNATTTNRSIEVVDTTKPTLVVTLPAAIDNGNSPTIDVQASDDKSGVNPASWSVTIDGQPLAVTGSTDRLQAAVGHIVNGEHTFVVSISDVAGNRLDVPITYTASSDAITPPGFDGLYVMSSPAMVFERQSYEVVAIAVVHGRPVGSGRFEISKDGTVIAGKDASPDGSVDMVATITTPGPLAMSLTGTTLAPASFAYAFNAVGSAPWCRSFYPDPACDKAFGTSGIPGLDHVAPIVSMALPLRRNVIRRGLDFQLKTTERASAKLTLPKRITRSATVLPGRTNHIRIVVRGAVALKLGLKPGKCLRLPVTLTAVDPAGNKIAPARYTFPVCG